MTDQLILFDYEALSTESSSRLRALAEDTKLRMKRTAEDIVHIGNNLIAAKEMLQHGQFLPWIKAEFGMSDESARRFMQVADRFTNIPQIVEFKPSILYELAAPSTPPEVTETALARAESGSPMSVKGIKTLKAQLKAASDEQEFSKNKIRQLQELQNRQAEEAQRQINEAQEKALEQARTETEDELLTMIEEKAEAEAKANELNQQLLSLQETRQTLQAQIKELESQPPQVEYKTPEKYKEMEEEEKAHEKRLKALKGKIQAAQEQMQAIKKELESMDGEKEQIAFKKSQMKAYRAVLIAFLSNAKKYELHLTDPVTYPGLEEKQKEIDRLKSEVVEFMSRAFAIEVESNQPTLLQ